MTSFIQINLHRSSTALNLLHATANDLDVQIALLSELPRGPPDDERSITGENNDCGIKLLRSGNLTIEASGLGKGLVWIRTGKLFIISCYYSPNATRSEFIESIGDLERIVSSFPSEADIIVGGDFNSKSHLWGSTSEDDRGFTLSEAIASMGLAVENIGDSPTFLRANSSSVIDVTFSRLTANSGVTDWKVLDIYSDSDHRYITFEYSVQNPYRTAVDPITPFRGPRWSVRKLDRTRCQEFISNEHSLDLVHLSSLPAESAADKLGRYLHDVCNACMPLRQSLQNHKRPVYWWSDEIASLRADCHAANRRYRRARRRGDDTTSIPLGIQFREKRKALTTAIKVAKQKAWSDLCHDVEHDPWGLPYKIVTKKLALHPPGAECRGKEREIAMVLFPSRPLTSWAETSNGIAPQSSPAPEEHHDPLSLPPPFTSTELSTAAKRLPSGKASGPDGIPNEALKLVANLNPTLLLEVMNNCLNERRFPKLWKTAKLILLHKGNDKPKDLPNSYRPISLLNTAGKLMERLILQRLNSHLVGTYSLAENQHGFRIGRSVEDAIRFVIKAAEAAAIGHWQDRDLCAMVCVDVRNAFNSAPWPKIDAALRKKAVPQYLIEITRSYLSDRSLIVDEGQPIEITCGVPQGSVLGPTLWNVFYDELLTMNWPAGVRLVAFADDVAILGTAHTGPLLERILNPALNQLSSWMRENGLEIAAQKTEAIILTKKWAYSDPELFIEGHPVPIKKSLKYLGVTLDQRLSFSKHVAIAAESASKTARAIARLMPNVSGPSNGKRHLLNAVVNSKLLFASSAWADTAFKTAKNRATVARAQRIIALRITRAYRTVADAAALMLAKTPPGYLLTQERGNIRRRLSSAAINISANQIKHEERRDTIQKWQRLWEEATKSRWTRELLPDVNRWLRAPVILTFHLTQVLTGHGCFKSYLFRMRRANNPYCVYCPDPQEDTVEHTVFECPRWDAIRLPVGQFLGGRTPKKDDVADLLCGPSLETLPDR